MTRLGDWAVLLACEAIVIGAFLLNIGVFD